MPEANRVLITGAGGFIGRACLPILVSQGYDVYGTYTKTAVGSLTNIKEWIYADLLNSSMRKNLIDTIKPDYLLHLAWDVSPGSRNSNVNLEWVDASLDLLTRFGDSPNAKWATVAGTCFEYDLTVNTKLIESYKSDTLYGTCKHNLYRLLQHTNIADRLSWGRIFYLFGPYEAPNRLVPMIIKSMLTTGKVEINSLPAIRKPFTYVDNVANALVDLLDETFPNVMDISSSTNISIKELSDTISDLIDNPNIKIHMGLRPIDEPEYINPFYNGNFVEKINLIRGLVRTINYWKGELNYGNRK